MLPGANQFPCVEVLELGVPMRSWLVHLTWFINAGLSADRGRCSDERRPRFLTICLTGTPRFAARSVSTRQLARLEPEAEVALLRLVRRRPEPQALDFAGPAWRFPSQ